MRPATGYEEMIRVPGGTFRMGSTGFYPEEGPVRDVTVDSFLVDRHLVTVREFGRFVDETGYVTVAERPLDPGDYPDADPELLVPGSLVFRQPAGRCRWTMRPPGGPTYPVRAGAIPKGPAAMWPHAAATR